MPAAPVTARNNSPACDRDWTSGVRSPVGSVLAPCKITGPVGEGHWPPPVNQLPPIHLSCSSSITTSTFSLRALTRNHLTLRHDEFTIAITQDHVHSTLEQTHKTGSGRDNARLHQTFHNARNGSKYGSITGLSPSPVITPTIRAQLRRGPAGRLRHLARSCLFETVATHLVAWLSNQRGGPSAPSTDFNRFFRRQQAPKVNRFIVQSD
jgi:hypothetical protein